MAAAHEAEVDFTMADIDRLSRKVPVLSKVAPAVPDVHMEDVHRAGGIMGILGSLSRAGLLHDSQPTVHSASMGEAIAAYDIAGEVSDAVSEFYRAAPGGVPTQVAFSQSRRFDDFDNDRKNGVIRDAEHAFNKDGGLAVLFGNLAEKGCIVKTAAVAEECFEFTGTARVFESQDAAVAAIMADGQVNAGNLRCEYDEKGNCIKVNICYGDERTEASDTCLGTVEERAWSSPIYVEHINGK